MKKNSLFFSLLALALAVSANAFADDLKLSDIISGEGSVSATGGGQTTTISGNPSEGNFNETTTQNPSNSNQADGGVRPNTLSDISGVEPTAFSGTAFDDQNAPLDGVTVKVRSLNSDVPFEAETVTRGGKYSFDKAPAGVQVEIIVSKPGFTTRRRVEVLKKGADQNRYDFGNDGKSGQFSADYQALSDLPEVTKVSPGRNTSGANPKTNFVLTFSEPMDKSTVEDNFIIRSFSNGGEKDFDESAKTLGNILTPGSSKSSDEDGVWDSSSFDLDWNSDDTEATFTFTDQRPLPSGGDTPDYVLTFHGDNQGRSMCDQSGACRNEDFFKLTDGDFENFYKFAIQTDENPLWGDAFGDNLGPSHIAPNPTPGNPLESGLGPEIFNAPGGPGNFPGAPYDDNLLNDPAFQEQRFVELFGGKFFDPNEN